MLALGNVYFVHIEIVDRCAGNGCVEAGIEVQSKFRSLSPTSVRSQQQAPRNCSHKLRINASLYTNHRSTRQLDMDRS